jgi:FKBP-type peptidyl-prolyl cis-trans isomerase
MNARQIAVDKTPPDLQPSRAEKPDSETTMKCSRLIPAGLFCVGMVTMIAAQEIQKKPSSQASAPVASVPQPTAPAQTPAAVPPRFSDEQIIEFMGWFAGKRLGLAELGLTPDQVDLLIKGMQECATGKPPPFDPQRIGPQMNAFGQKRQAAFRARVRDENLAAAKAFFEKLKGNPSVIELPSGLRYEILKPGEGACPTPADTVKVYYTGKLLNDTVFDRAAPPAKPWESRLNRVIPGWTEGLQKINPGGQIRLYVPSNLAYGDNGTPNIPPGSTLIFDIELVEVKPAPPPPVVRPVPPAPVVPPASPASVPPAATTH